MAKFYWYCVSERNRFEFHICIISGVLGVAQLCNKVNGSSFTKFDEELTAGFAVFCGLGLVQVSVAIKTFL